MIFVLTVVERPMNNKSLNFRCIKERKQSKNYFPDTWKCQECKNEGRTLKTFMPVAMKSTS